MILARSVVYFALLFVTTLFYALVIILFGWLMPVRMRNNIANQWAGLNLWLQKTICGLSYRVYHPENLPVEPAIVMSKHQSAWETISLRHIVGGIQSWVMKRELVWIPVFGWAINMMSPIAINRDAGRQAVLQVIDQGIKYLNKNHHVMIFPEGTRTAPGKPGRYGMGGAILAQKSGFPVVPIAHNAGVFWKRRGVRKYPGIIDVVVGPKIETENRSAKEIIREVEAWIEMEMEKLPLHNEHTKNDD